MLDFDNYIFDFGGVLLNIDYNKTSTAFKSMGFQFFDEVYSQAIQNEWFDQYEIGAISSQRFINGILSLLQNQTSPNNIVHAWNAMLGDVIIENVRFVEELKKRGKRVYLLSNTNEIHIELAFKRWRSLEILSPEELFEEVYLSHEVKLRKPDPEIFKKVIQDHDLVPTNSLFIDDSAQHIEGARSVGLNTLHVVSNALLKDYFS